MAADYDAQCRLAGKLAKEFFDAKKCTGQGPAINKDRTGMRETSRRLAVLGFHKIGPPLRGTRALGFTFPNRSSKAFCDGYKEAPGR
jgi:hypothetical protein